MTWLLITSRLITTHMIAAGYLYGGRGDDPYIGLVREGMCHQPRLGGQ